MDLGDSSQADRERHEGARSEAFSAWLRSELKRAGMTKEQFATAAGLPIQSVRKATGGTWLPAVGLLEWMAEVLDATIPVGIMALAPARTNLSQSVKDAQERFYAQRKQVAEPTPDDLLRTAVKALTLLHDKAAHRELSTLDNVLDWLKLHGPAMTDEQRWQVVSAVSSY